jgi:hypothetical protein
MSKSATADLVGANPESIATKSEVLEGESRILTDCDYGFRLSLRSAGTTRGNQRACAEATGRVAASAMPLARSFATQA